MMVVPTMSQVHVPNTSTGGKRCCSDSLQKELAKSDSNYRVTVPGL